MVYAGGNPGSGTASCRSSHLHRGSITQTGHRPGVSEEVLRLHDSQGSIYWDDANQADLNKERGTPLRLRSQHPSQAERKQHEEAKCSLIRSTANRSGIHFVHRRNCSAELPPVCFGHERGFGCGFSPYNQHRRGCILVHDQKRRICHLRRLSRHHGSSCYPFSRRYTQKHHVYANHHSAGRCRSSKLRPTVKSKT
jgi:hypothetical protein